MSMPSDLKELVLKCAFCGRTGPHRVRWRNGKGFTARCLSCQTLHSAGSATVTHEANLHCEFEHARTPHMVVHDWFGVLAWCQHCFRVRVLEDQDQILPHHH